tara:strand:- start:548 stop:1024 length:477 start_codon:yes stop_codon:yes gene_type:complete
MNSRIILLYVSLALAILIVGLALGGYFGRQAGQSAARGEFRAMLDLAFPPPPQDLQRLSGTVRGVFGGTINIDVSDPDDYLPHLDRSPRNTELRYANVSGITEYILIDYSNPDEIGNASQSNFELPALKKGDQIVVESRENIRDKEEFEVVRVEMVKF